jgi:hypothetical protein
MLAIAYWPTWAAWAVGCGVAVTTCWAVDLLTSSRATVLDGGQ